MPEDLVSVFVHVCVAQRNEYIPMGIGEQPDSERQEPLLVQAKVFLMETQRMFVMDPRQINFPSVTSVLVRRQIEKECTDAA